MDINQQIRDLDPNKLKLTFKDIYTDYQHFRSAYYFQQVESPREVFDRNQIPVDVKNFKFFKWLVEFFKKGDDHRRFSVQEYFYKICMLLILWALWRLCRKPIEKYYHWDDPLKSHTDAVGT